MRKHISEFQAGENMGWLLPLQNGITHLFTVTSTKKKKIKIMTMNVLRKYDMHNPISGGQLTLVHSPNKTDYRIHLLTKKLK